MRHQIHLGHLWELMFQSCSCDLPNQIQVRIWYDRQGNGVLFDCQGLFFFLCTTFSCVCRVSVFLQEVGEIVQEHSEVFKKKFWCSQGQTKVFFFIFCDRSQTILVKHPFPLSHIRALTILLFESMAIYKGPLQFVFDSSGTWKQEAKVQV